MQPTSDQLLFELKARGSATTRDLAIRAGITRQAAREHLTKPGVAKLVEHTKTAAGIGRPGHTWSLTEKGHGRFADTHAQMIVELIETIRSEFGEAGLARMLARREQAMAEKYKQALRGALEQRVARLVRLRSTEGYMADASRLDDGTYVIVENHCRSAPPLPLVRAAAVPSSRCSHGSSRRRGWNAPSPCSRVADAAVIGLCRPVSDGAFEV